MTIRLASVADAEGICAAHQASVRGLCAADYSPTEIEAWVGRLRPDGYVRSISGERMWVADEHGSILGFAARSGDEIRAVYVRPEVARQGVGRRLLQAAEASARAEGVALLRLDASVTAVPFYEQMGYVIRARGVHRLSDGTEIPSATMEKQLL